MTCPRPHSQQVIRALTQVWLIVALIPPVLQPKQAQACGNAEASALDSGERRGGQDVRTEARGDLSCRVREIQPQCPRTPYAAQSQQTHSGYYPLEQSAPPKLPGLSHMGWGTEKDWGWWLKATRLCPRHLACRAWCRTLCEVRVLYGSC